MIAVLVMAAIVAVLTLVIGNMDHRNAPELLTLMMVVLWVLAVVMLVRAAWPLLTA
jgi:hypothetical protein